MGQGFGECPKCGKMSLVTRKNKYRKTPSGTTHWYLVTEYVYECLNCGWNKKREKRIPTDPPD